MTACWKGLRTEGSRRLAVIATVAVAGLSLAACGGDDGDDTQATPAPTPAPDTAGSTTSGDGTPAAGGYPEGAGFTEEVKSTYVSNCVEGGESEDLCRCRIEYLAENVPYEDFRTPTARFDQALAKAEESCGSGGSAPTEPESDPSAIPEDVLDDIEGR